MQTNVDASTGPRCNIGPDEIRRRRSLATALTIATVVIAAGLVALQVPPLARLGLWPFAAASGVTWLQVTHRFCVRFGLGGLENFGRLGEERRVAAPLAEADQRQALKLIAQGVLAGLVATLALVVLPL